MKIFKNLTAVLIILATVFVLFGCKKAEVKEEEFTYSKNLDDKGYWENVKATDYVDLVDYKGIVIPKDVHAISDEDVNEQIEAILSQFATEVEVKDRAAKDKDTINIDYSGSVDGVLFDGGTAKDKEVTIGVTNFVDDFLQQIIGHKPGDTFDVNVTFPNDYHEESLQGKDAVFVVTLNYIIELKYPELDDDFVSENLKEDYGWSTAEQMKKEIKDELQASAIMDYIETYINEKSTCKSLPEPVLSYQEQYIVKYFENEAAQYGITLDKYLEYMSIKDTAELIEKNRKDIENATKSAVIIQAIAENEKITASTDDVAKFFEKYSGDSDYSQYEEFYGLNYLKMTVVTDNVLAYLESVSVKE